MRTMSVTRVRGPRTQRGIAPTRFHLTRAWLAMASLCGVAACDSPVQPLTYTVGGEVSGLAGSGLVLVNNGGDNLAVSADGPVTFASALAKGAGYRITVLTQPTSPTQTCVVSGGSGTVTADVTTVAVACFMAGAASPFLVSSPVPGPSATAVYVSLPPGAIPSGSTATISDLRTGGSVNAAVVDGGFDPVALPAIEGDTLVVVVPATGGAGPKSFLSVVAAATAPSVVRTDPPPHQQDVSPKSIVVVVFSEPLDSATVDDRLGRAPQRHHAGPGHGAIRRCRAPPGGIPPGRLPGAADRLPAGPEPGDPRRERPGARLGGHRPIHHRDHRARHEPGVRLGERWQRPHLRSDDGGRRVLLGRQRHRRRSVTAPGPAVPPPCPCGWAHLRGGERGWRTHMRA